MAQRGHNPQVQNHCNIARFCLPFLLFSEAWGGGAWLGSLSIHSGYQKVNDVQHSWTLFLEDAESILAFIILDFSQETTLKSQVTSWLHSFVQFYPRPHWACWGMVLRWGSSSYLRVKKGCEKIRPSTHTKRSPGHRGLLVIMVQWLHSGPLRY